MDKITLNLTVNEINTILTALAKMPYEAVSDVINKVRADSLKQLNVAKPEEIEETE